MQGRRCWALGFDPIRENLRRSNPVRVIIDKFKFFNNFNE